MEDQKVSIMRKMAEAVQSQSIGNTVGIQLVTKQAVPDDAHPNESKNQERRAAPAPADATKWPADPAESLANSRHEFGEHGGVNMSIEASATFTVMEPDILPKIFTGELGPDRDFYLYSRHFNPTVLNLSRQIAAMEGTEAAYCTASGMSAIFSVLLQLCPAGSHIVASRCLYGGTYALLSKFLPRMAGLKTTFVDVSDLESVGWAVREGETRVIYVETMSNPTLAVADIPGLSAVAREKGVMLVVDNTFTPMVVSPARLGADVVLHSVSKFISGGADIIAGAICGPSTLINSMMDIHGGILMMLGPTMNAKVAFELSERLPHLALRMKEHCTRAMLYASRMEQLGLKVIYPGLANHTHHHLLRSLVNPGYGFGGMLCLDMGTEERANRLLYHLQNTTQFGLIAVSLGYYETLMSCSGSSTASKLSEEEKLFAGISPGLVRMSVGYSGSVEQRWAQFETALAACAKEDASWNVTI